MKVANATQDQLIARTTELERRLRVLEAVLGHINQGVSFFNDELTLDFCNQRYLELLKFPLEFGTPANTGWKFRANICGCSEHRDG